MGSRGGWIGLLAEVDSLIAGWVADKRIPSAVLEIRMSNQLKHQAAFGDAVLSTIYDAASLTKVVVTLPAIMRLVQRSQLSLTDAVQQYVPEFRHPHVTIAQCLTHTSGLPGSVPSFLERYTNRDIVQEVLAQELQYEPGSRMQYSDVGMILIGWIVEKVSGKPLDFFAQDEIFEPLRLTSSCFNPSGEQLRRTAPTEWDGSQYLLGQVHDESAYRLGGVSGSAGLFAAASDIADYAEACWLYPERGGLLSRNTVDYCMQQPVFGRGIGWQVKVDAAGAGLACGARWPEGSFGHTGFTGTSLWIDPKHEITVVFLTNAVHYGRNNSIKELRPLLHDAIAEALMK